MTVYFDIHTHKTAADDPLVIEFFNQIIAERTTPTSSYTVGIHPCYIGEDPQAQSIQLEQAVGHNEVVAVGECGLDKICNTDWELQIRMFREQIQLANRIQKPLIIHCVRAYDEVTRIIKEEKSKVPVVFHGVNKKKDLLFSLLNRGYYIGLGAFILKGRHDDFIKTADLEKIFLETDNNPTCIKDIYAYFCQIRNISLEQLKQQIAHNVEKVFEYKVRQ